MPNVKIYVDEALGREVRQDLCAALPALRDLLCRELDVERAVVQLMLVPVLGLPDQAQLSVEMQIMPRPERTREQLTAACATLRDAFRAVAAVKTAIRITVIDPAGYLVLR